MHPPLEAVSGCGLSRCGAWCPGANVGNGTLPETACDESRPYRQLIFRIVFCVSLAHVMDRARSCPVFAINAQSAE
jgi:hypothetical protein